MTLQIFMMTSHLDSHMTTDIKPEILSCVQTGNGTPHDKYDKRGIAHVRTDRKDDIFMQRRLYIDEAHLCRTSFSKISIICAATGVAHLDFLYHHICLS